MARCGAAVCAGWGSLELVERDVPAPARAELRVHVEVCGVCHSDSLTGEGSWPALFFPVLGACGISSRAGVAG
jgi:D-arabinose 1-dehydrogenase-like Zn-dependent alcohol dehydrogenase